MFDWNDLKYFLAVARTGSTLEAAKALRVSQLTVQRRLAALEQQLGRTLVEHNPTGYCLTELGEELRPHAEVVEEAFAAFERQVIASDKGPAGTIRVTCAEGMAPRFVMPLIQAFQAKYPRLLVDLMITDRYLDLTKGEADIAVRASVPGDEMLIARKIADAPWAVYASQSYIERHGRPERIGDIEQHNVIEFSGEMVNNRAGKWLRTVAAKANIAAHGDSMLGLLAAVKSGAGLAPLPMMLAEPEDELVRVLDPLTALESKIYLVIHHDLRRSPRVRAFVDFVVAEVEKFRPWLRGERRR